MRALLVLAVWGCAAAAAATVGWLVRSRGRAPIRDDESDAEAPSDDSDPVRVVEPDRTTLLAVVGFAAIGYEAWSRAAGDPFGPAAVAGVLTGGLVAAALEDPRDGPWPRAPAVPTVRVSLPEPSLPTSSVGGDDGAAADADDGAALPATPEQVADDGTGAAASDSGVDDGVTTGLRPSPDDDGTREAPTPTAVSLSDGDPANRPDGPVVFTDGAGEREECRNCGSAGDVRATRIATVPDREADRLPLCDDCRIAAAARDDDPEDCAALGRRVASVGGENGRCDNCGYIGRLSAHAVVPLSDGGEAHHANAVALCETCHAAAHGQRETELTQ